MNRDTHERSNVPDDPSRQPPIDDRRQDWGAQMKGAVIGAAAGLALAWLAQQLGWFNGNLVTLALWGAVIGGLVGGSDALERAGQRLTRRDQRWVNILVGLVGMAIVFGAILLLSYGVSRLLRPFLTR